MREGERQEKEDMCRNKDWERNREGKVKGRWGKKVRRRKGRH